MHESFSFYTIFFIDMLPVGTSTKVGIFIGYKLLNLRLWTGHSLKPRF